MTLVKPVARQSPGQCHGRPSSEATVPHSRSEFFPYWIEFGSQVGMHINITACFLGSSLAKISSSNQRTGRKCHAAMNLAAVKGARFFRGWVS